MRVLIRLISVLVVALLSASCADEVDIDHVSAPACPSAADVAAILAGPVVDNGNAAMGLCLFQGSSADGVGASILSAPASSQMWATNSVREALVGDLQSGVAQPFPAGSSAELSGRSPEKRKAVVFLRSGSVRRSLVLAFGRGGVDAAAAQPLFGRFNELAMNAPVCCDALGEGS